MDDEKVGELPVYNCGEGGSPGFLHNLQGGLVGLGEVLGDFSIDGKHDLLEISVALKSNKNI